MNKFRLISLTLGLSVAACGTQQISTRSAANAGHGQTLDATVVAPSGQAARASGSDGELGESFGAEPESLTVQARSVQGAGRTIPNVFLGLDRCGPGTERSDLRTDSLGEVACRDGRGELEGPYASNLLDPTSDLPAGTAERGQYEGGVRVGTWFKMRWGGSPFVSYEVETYQDGQLVNAKALGEGNPPPPWQGSSVPVAAPSTTTGGENHATRREQASGFARTQSE